MGCNFAENAIVMVKEVKRYANEQLEMGFCGDYTEVENEIGDCRFASLVWLVERRSKYRQPREAPRSIKAAAASSTVCFKISSPTTLHPIKL